MTDNSLDIETALAMAAGQDIHAIYDNSVDDADKQLVRDALENIFQGSSVILWANGGTLQNAWNITLNNMRDEFFTTSRRDVLTIFLQRAVFEHNKKWSAKMISNDNRFQMISGLKLNAEQTQELLKQAQFQKQQGYDTIKKLFQKYDDGFKPAKNTAKNVVNALNMERGRERDEYVHERTK